MFPHNPAKVVGDCINRQPNTLYWAELSVWLAIVNNDVTSQNDTCQAAGSVVRQTYVVYWYIIVTSAQTAPAIVQRKFVDCNGIIPSYNEITISQVLQRR